MAASNFPRKLTAGLTFTHLVELGRYPAPEWSLTLSMRGPNSINLQATAAGKHHEIRASAQETAQWAAGMYWFSARVSNQSGDVHEVASGKVEVLPDLSAQDEGYDGRSHARRMLDAIEAVLEKRATIDQERYRIGNRELYRTPLPELKRARKEYLEEVAREEAAARGGTMWGRKVAVRL